MPAPLKLTHSQAARQRRLDEHHALSRGRAAIIVPADSYSVLKLLVDHMTLSPRQACALLNLARSTIRAVLGGDAGRDSNPSNLATIDPQIANDPALQQPAGCFVSLHDLVSRRLRGCVGRLDARDPLHLAVIDSARSVLDDPRFGHDPVTLQQLARMEIEITADKNDPATGRFSIRWGKHELSAPVRFHFAGAKDATAPKK